MESRRKRNRKLATKWAAFGGLLLLCTVLETMPGFLQLGQAKPLFILPLCLAIAIFEGEFSGALFAVVGGLTWDMIAGRTVGMLALCLMLLCFFVSIVMQLYFRSSLLNLLLIQTLSVLLVLSGDHLFFYVMPGYANALGRYLWYVLPTAIMTVAVSVPLFYLVKRISASMRWSDSVI